MTRLGSRSLAGELNRIRSVSSKIEARMSELRPSEEARIDGLTYEELQDLAKIAGIADFMVCKYAESKNMHRILKEFAAIITSTADSLDSIDDEMSELILSVEDSIGRVKDMHSSIHEKSDVCRRHAGTADSPINLTNSITQINPSKYQQNPQGHATR
ncbi:MAG: hypothetical protein EB829_02845 [Nitrosopumilus sp. H8]|nr:MAG: hypothetical protein EB830_02335 [Nitrosopumilus sp. H13]RNJ79112.1 MAG: hypothetical protein EB829_02845 [Nitrosopumilus sp. H8]